MSRSRRKKSQRYPKLKHSEIAKLPPKPPVLSNELSHEITKDKSPITKRNDNGDLIYSCQYIGYEKFEYNIDYDTSRRPIKYQDSRGASWECIYNGKGNICYYWDNTGYEESYKYYARNLVICTTSFGNKIKKKVVSNKFITREIFICSEDY